MWNLKRKTNDQKKKKKIKTNSWTQRKNWMVARREGVGGVGKNGEGGEKHELPVMEEVVEWNVQHRDIP